MQPPQERVDLSAPGETGPPEAVHDWAPGVMLHRVRIWLKLGRCVRRGEKGLVVLAPMTLKPARRGPRGWR
jgi:hypothetical protein